MAECVSALYNEYSRTLFTSSPGVSKRGKYHALEGVSLDKEQKYYGGFADVGYFPEHQNGQSSYMLSTYYFNFNNVKASINLRQSMNVASGLPTFGEWNRKS